MSWSRVASWGELESRGVLGVEVDGVKLAVYRLDEEVFATQGICTHALAYLSDGWMEGGTIECPLHQAIFDIRTGKALCAPAVQDLRTYAAKREGDDVFVALDLPGDAPAELDKRASAKVSRRVAIIGAGQAAAAAIRALRSAGFAGEINLIGEENWLPYERPPLSKEFLSRERAAAPDFLLTEKEISEFDVSLHIGVAAVGLNASERTIMLADGRSVPYDDVLLAQGGAPRRLSIPGGDLSKVHYLRTIEDALRIREALETSNRVVIIGGGLIGLELASTARARGVEAILLERESALMTRLMPRPVGAVFRGLAEKSGVEVHCGVVVEEIVEEGRGLRVRCADRSFKADVVLVGLGIDPRIDLALQAGCRCDKGIVIDPEGRTSVANVWAAGDCASLDGQLVRLESWQNAEEQGRRAGLSIAAAAVPERKMPWFWTDQFGFNIQFMGPSRAQDLVVVSGAHPPAIGSVYRTIDPATRRLTSVIAFSDPGAIRGARAQIEASEPFDWEAAGARLISDEAGHPSATTEKDLAMDDQVERAAGGFVWANDDLSEIPDWVYTDQSIYDLEVEKIFHGPTWNFVALEAELPEPGNFIRSNVGPTPVVVARAEDGSINVFENRCAHRAAEFCRELRGKATEFVCPYHQWSYDLRGNLAGIPFRRGVNGAGGMPSSFKPADHGPRKLNVTVHRGVVFASYSYDVEPLAEYLGAKLFKEFEATFDGRKLRVLGHYRHSLPGNWKLYHENLRDPYHATLLHTFLVTFGLLSPGNKSLMYLDENGRHGIMASAKSDAKKMSGDTKKEMRAYREDMILKEARFMDFIEEFDSPWSVIMATVWPNLIVQREMNTLGIRHIIPAGPHEFIMKWTMFGFEDDDDEMTRHRLRQGNLMGPAGFLGLEDNEAIKFVQDGMKRVPGGRHLVKLDPANPAGASETVISEAAIRGMYKYWRKEMGI